MTDSQPERCPGTCPSCPAASGDGAEAWADAHDKAAGAGPRGARMLLAAAVAFVLPLVGALLGAVLAGPGESRRFVGMAVGFAVGAAAGIVTTRLMPGRSGLQIGNDADAGIEESS